MSNEGTDNYLMDVEQTIDIEAAAGDVYQGVIDKMTRFGTGAEGEPLPLTLEQWPGGRWFRDLGSGAGHLWGFVQSIKPPALIEICGPLFMSFAVAGNLIIRVKPISGGATVTLRHQVFGSFPGEYREGLTKGWVQFVEEVKKNTEA